jgi:hypothetical protein
MRFDHRLLKAATVIMAGWPPSSEVDPCGHRLGVGWHWLGGKHGLFGGIMVISDKPVNVGDVQVGEAVNRRRYWHSSDVTGRDRTVVWFPTVNWPRAWKIYWWIVSTTDWDSHDADQLVMLPDPLPSMLSQGSPVRPTGSSGSGLLSEVEIFAYVRIRPDGVPGHSGRALHQDTGCPVAQSSSPADRVVDEITVAPV